MLPTIDWQGDTIVMVDQRKLPGQEIYVRCRTAQEVARAIRTMVIRGAPAIGVAAAMGLALGMRRSTAKGTRQFAVEFQKNCQMMASTRPTAVNLFWAIDRMKRSFSAGAQAGESVAELTARLVREAQAIHDEDVASCKAMGQFGAQVVPDAARILTLTWLANRPILGLCAVHMADAALSAALKYAGERVQFGRTIGQTQLVQEMLADISTAVTTSRLLCYYALSCIDNGDRANQISAMAKRYAIATCTRAVSLAMEVHGAMGISSELGLERHYRDIRMLPIPDGTNQILTLIEGRELTGTQAYRV